MRRPQPALRHLSPSLIFLVLSMSLPGWGQAPVLPTKARFQLVGPAAGSQRVLLFRDSGPSLVSSGTRFSVPRPSTGLAPSFAQLPQDDIRQADDLVRLSRRIPLAGSLIQRIQQETRSHPQLTRVLRFVVRAK